MTTICGSVSTSNFTVSLLLQAECVLQTSTFSGPVNGLIWFNNSGSDDLLAVCIGKSTVSLIFLLIHPIMAAINPIYQLYI